MTARHPDVYIDFETRSAADLRAIGADKYAAHPTTDVWCMAYAGPEGDVRLWKMGEPFPFNRFDTAVVCAHNAPFELTIWNRLLVPRHGWPELKPENCVDTMAMAYAMGLPGALDKLAVVVGIEEGKDMKGHRLMLQLARPRRMEGDKPVWWDDPDKLERLYRYCKHDVVVEREVYKKLLPLPPIEQKTWVLDQKINQRGVYVDVPLIRKMIDLVEAETKKLNQEMAKVTDGTADRCTAVRDITDWLRSKGVKVSGIAKADVTRLLARDDLPPECRRALELRREAAKSSTAKLRAMLEGAMGDNRVRGTLQYHGASTGRWAGRKIQIQNYPRPTLDQDEIEAVLKLLRDNRSYQD